MLLCSIFVLGTSRSPAGKGLVQDGHLSLALSPNGRRGDGGAEQTRIVCLHSILLSRNYRERRVLIISATHFSLERCRARTGLEECHVLVPIPEGVLQVRLVAPECFVVFLPTTTDVTVVARIGRAGVQRKFRFGLVEQRVKRGEPS